MNRNFRLSALCCLSLIAALAAFVSCNKIDAVNKDLDPDAQTRFDFMSTKTGSYWHYVPRDSSSIEFIRYARGRDSVKNGLKYSYYERQGAGSAEFAPEYFGKNSDKYITLLDLDGTESNYLEYVYYIEGATLGMSFANVGKVGSPIGDVTVKLVSNVAETGLIMRVGSGQVTNVIHVHTNCTGGVFNVKLGTVDTWFARDIGIIKEEANIDILGQYSLKHLDSLIDYHIAP